MVSHSLPVLLCAGHLRPLWGRAPSPVFQAADAWMAEGDDGLPDI